MSEQIEQPQVFENAENAKTENVNTLPANTETSGSFGKFKDARSLLKAYNLLEAEFTRRSQRLKELESAYNGEDNAKAPSISDTETESGDNEQSPPPEETKSVTNKYAEFFAKYPQAVKYSGEILAAAVNGGSFADSGGGLEEIYINTLINNLSDKNTIANDEDFLSKFIYPNEKIKDYIISGYLRDFLSAAPRAKLLGEGSGAAVAAPPHRPKTLEEAGALAREVIGKR